MNRKQSDGEDSVVETGTDRFVDATVETGVGLRLLWKLTWNQNIYARISQYAWELLA